MSTLPFWSFVSRGFKVLAEVAFECMVWFGQGQAQVLCENDCTGLASVSISKDS